MKIIGMDIHRSFAQVAMLEDGKITNQMRVELTHEPLVAFAKTLSLEDEVVIEVTGRPRGEHAIVEAETSRMRAHDEAAPGKSASVKLRASAME